MVVGEYGPKRFRIYLFILFTFSWGVSEVLPARCVRMRNIARSVTRPPRARHPPPPPRSYAARTRVRIAMRPCDDRVLRNKCFVTEGSGRPTGPRPTQ